MVIGDRVRVFSGGMNVAKEYMGPKPFQGRWSDLSFRIEGPAVRPFCDVHDSDWGAVGGGPSSEAAGTRPPTWGRAAPIAQLVPSGPDRKDDALHDGLVYAIHAARRRVWIATPYFLPTEFLGQALATAARRGLDVRIVVPQRSNHRIADFARGAYVRELAERRMPRSCCSRKGMLHAKAGIIDDAAYVGSANFDVRSMLLNFETAMFLYDEPSVEKVAGMVRAARGGQPGLHPERRRAQEIYRGSFPARFSGALAPSAEGGGPTTFEWPVFAHKTIECAPRASAATMS